MNFILRSPAPVKRAPAALKLAAALLAVGALASCAGSPGSEPESVEGVWGDAGDAGAPSLDFAPDGRVSGTDGCNNLMGRWTQDGSSVTLNEMTSTLIGCPDVDVWLSAAATAEVDAGTLELFNEDGEPIGTLQR